MSSASPAPDEAPRILTPANSVRTKLGAFGKALAYLLLAAIGMLLATAVAKGVFGANLLEMAQRGTAMAVVRSILLLMGVVVLPTVVMLLATKAPIAVSGWSPINATKVAGIGAATGFLLLTIIALILWVSGSVRFDVAAASFSSGIRACLGSLIVWTALAIGEEGLHRGYAFVHACRAISFWPAAILSSAWFLTGHIGNSGETVFGLIAAGLFGLALAYSLLKTGSLWFAVGFHAAWNFTQSFIFGFSNSGAKPPASLLLATTAGSPIMTGGATGPEASILVLPAILLLIVTIRRITAADVPEKAT